MHQELSQEHIQSRLTLSHRIASQVPISFHKPTDPSWAEHFGREDVSLEEEEYPLQKENVFIGLKDGER